MFRVAWCIAIAVLWPRSILMWRLLQSPVRSAGSYSDHSPATASVQAIGERETDGETGITPNQKKGGKKRRRDAHGLRQQSFTEHHRDRVFKEALQRFRRANRCSAFGGLFQAVMQASSTVHSSQVPLPLDEGTKQSHDDCEPQRWQRIAEYLCPGLRNS